ncbi:hypothetical protein CCACVL1_24937 [Corchorus capsularis]|uniref:Uncharacterized protein n=1 Tax=Corchorus capsularis TaxID=210143 RepID=A0A1R3GMF9_COCAP|nr:hypothetical protein CCACVL1_24937 [Corchorus capsularis]
MANTWAGKITATSSNEMKKIKKRATTNDGAPYSALYDE